MKIKVFTLILSLVIITLTVISCVDIPIDGPAVSGNSEIENNSASHGISDPGDTSKEESADASLPDDSSSDDASSGAPDTSVDDSSEPESSDVPHYPTPEDYPYQDIENIGSYTIGEDSLDEYFRDSVFVGNSIMVHFQNYISGKRAKDSAFLGKCKILARSAYSPKLEFDAVPQPDYMIKYQGEAMHVWDAIKAMEAKTVYINLMALNELGLHPTATCAEDAFANTARMIEKIKEVNPGINIVVLSNTYMVNTFNYRNLNNANIYKLNCLALDYCNQNGIDFLDVSSPLTVDGYLKYEYCLDPDPSNGNGCHLKEKCYDAWVAILRNYAYAKQNGGHKNIEVMPEP